MTTISESSKRPKKYRGLSHSEIIEKQTKELHDVITSPAPTTTLEEGGCELTKKEIETLNTQQTIEGKKIGELPDATKKYLSIRPEETLYSFGGALGSVSKFVLAGLGKSGKDCRKLVMSDIDIGEDEDDVKAVKFNRLCCSRIECPDCYYEWAIRQTFDIALKVEAMALIRDERPFHVIFSVHPSKCKKMTWGDVNQSIWRRGVRRLRYKRCKTIRDFKKHRVKDCHRCRGDVRCDIHERGMEHNVEECPDCYDFEEYGGTGIFHPLRVRKEWKMEWSRGRKVNATHEDDLRSGKFWEKIRKKIKEENEKLEKYTKIGFHCHNWVFTDHPEKQENKKYMIKFAQNFKRFEREEVVALTRYLVTHTATIREKAIYNNNRCNHCGHSRKVNKYRCGHCGRTDEIEETHVVRNRIIHPIRDYGILHRFDPKQGLIEKFGKERGTKLYHDLAHKIAELLYLRRKDDEIVTMVWNEETETLEYPAYPQQFTTSDEHANWKNIWKLFDLCSETSYLWDLPNEKRIFVQDLLDYMRDRGKPPPFEECGRSPNDYLNIPDGVAIVVPVQKLEFPSSDEIEDLADASLLKGQIIELIHKGEDDVFKLDICLADVEFGSILRTVNLLCRDGLLIRQPDGELVLGV